jgi:hypothetical protein
MSAPDRAALIAALKTVEKRDWVRRPAPEPEPLAISAAAIAQARALQEPGNTIDDDLRAARENEADGTEET